MNVLSCGYQYIHTYIPAYLPTYLPSVDVAAIPVDAACDLDSLSPGDEPPNDVDEFHCNSSGPEYPDAESRAWGILSQISVSDIISSCTVTTITKIAAGVSTLYQDCCAIPLNGISVN